jgi:hypothetical protein
MKTQSQDTSPAAEHYLIGLIRKAPFSQRFARVRATTGEICLAKRNSWRQNHPSASERDFIALHYGSGIAQALPTNLELEWQPVAPFDILETMLPAISVCEQLGISCYLAGSVASSLHGMPQFAHDVDLVADLDASRLEALLDLLSKTYAFFGQQTAYEATEQRTSFSLLHRQTLLKLDIVLPQQNAFEKNMRKLVSAHILEKHQPIRTASAYEMILIKLDRFHRKQQRRTDGMIDDAEWNDIEGMLKVQGPDLNIDFLVWWAKALKMSEVLQNALIDAGLREG